MRWPEVEKVGSAHGQVYPAMDTFDVVHHGTNCFGNDSRIPYFGESKQHADELDDKLVVPTQGFHERREFVVTLVRLFARAHSLSEGVCYQDVGT